MAGPKVSVIHVPRHVRRLQLTRLQNTEAVPKNNDKAVRPICAAYMKTRNSLVTLAFIPGRAGRLTDAIIIIVR